ncbi:MAG: hemolysin family protein [Candidatus Woesearchaeota archaeon]|jgi:CBS domain containing-hemolysin-like protein|nr:hemolysin family protein [Candidatus Woesearchaeota archaeon]
MIPNEIYTLVVLLVLSAFFSGSETALASVNKLKAKHLLGQKKRGAKILYKLKEDTHRMLITILIGNNVVNVATAAITTKLVIDLGFSNAIGIATGITTLLLLIFGEISPKSIATQHSEFIALLVARPIWILSIILFPLMKILDWFVQLLNKILGIKKKETIVTEDELKSYVKAGEEAGSIKEIEKEMIHNIFKFDEINVKEIMTPRPDMTCISVDKKVKEVLGLIKKTPFSRFPIYEKTRDHIKGILNVKDIYQYIGKKGFNELLVSKIMRKPFFIPQTVKTDNILRQFQKRKEHMAIVVDEHGIVSGLVTIEDVLEEIVGEIVDETEKVMPNIKKLSKKSWLIMGKADVDEVNEKLKTQFKGKGFETFGGFVLHKEGKIPQEGDIVELDKKYKAIIKEIKDRRIISIKLTKK